MNWDAVGAVGEVVGAAAVVVSLIYVGFQIRQNTSSAQAATFQSYVENAMGWMASVYEDAELCDLWRRGNEDLDSLNANDKDRYSFLQLAFFRMFENVYLQVQKGFVKHEQWEGLRESYLMLIDAPGLQQWWRDNARRYSNSFREFVDSELRNRTA